MAYILLVEPRYRSKFPPIGLMKISSFHKQLGDDVYFVRGMNKILRTHIWDRIYISSLFTYDLNTTIKTASFYRNSVTTKENIIIGGIAATLMPEYIKNHFNCTVITGQLNKPGMLGGGTPTISDFTPDYDLLKETLYDYNPKDTYFLRITEGCIRKCKFCAVPKLEPEFKFQRDLSIQIDEVNTRYGEKQDLVLFDNNILALDSFSSIVSQIRNCGFEKNAKRNGKKRYIDFNQGIDARLITDNITNLLSTIAVRPIRLAFDDESIYKEYTAAINKLSSKGFVDYTNYVMFNFNDDPRNFYNRIRINGELSRQYNIRVTSFPMRYIPINDIKRGYVSPKWKWRYLRGIQCILNGTHGVVSPNPEFLDIAFGDSYEKFLEILTMPDRYIIYRKHYQYNETSKWRKLYLNLSDSDKLELVDILEEIHFTKDKKKAISIYPKYKKILEHYYPNGEVPKMEKNENI